MPREEYEVALWYIHYGSPDYELCEDEEDATQSAIWIEDAGSGAVLGVQFADGRLFKVGRWEAYKAARKRQSEEWAREREAFKARPRPVMRTARDPFEHRQVEIEASEPAWLGEAVSPPDRPASPPVA